MRVIAAAGGAKGTVATIGLDIAKSSFQVHGADAAGLKLFNRRLKRLQVLDFFATQPRCLVGMEACSSSHHWAREIAALGHDARIIPVKYVTPLVKRQKTDAADAAAICEAAVRPNMRFVPVKSAEHQASGLLFRTRELFVKQRTQVVRAMRGHWAEFGQIAPRGIEAAMKLGEHLAGELDAAIPAAAREMSRMMVHIVEQLSQSIADIDGEVRRRARNDQMARRLMTIPGIGPLIATAIIALAPPLETFGSGRDFAAWLGLTPRQCSTGGKIRLGRISKMGSSALRQMLFLGAHSVVLQAHRKDAVERDWLKNLLARKPRKLACVALANKTARIVWAVATKQENYRSPTAMCR